MIQLRRRCPASCPTSILLCDLALLDFALINYFSGSLGLLLKCDAGGLLAAL